MYGGLRGLWLAGWAALALLAGCGSVASEARDTNGGPPRYNPWIAGGQTGSLRPRCGVTENAIESGVPASSEGFVVYTGQCQGVAFSPQGLTLRGPDGEAVPFAVWPLNGGAVLIAPTGMLAPGTYTFGNGVAPTDDDAGVEDDDAGLRDTPLDPAGAVIEETVVVQPAAPAPTTFGTITRVGDACSPTFELVLDPNTVAHASLLAINVQIDGSEARPFIGFGTLEVRDGVGLVTLPEDMWTDLYQGAHTLTWTVHLADQSSAPLTVIEMPLEVACEAPYTPQPYEDEGTFCTLSHARSRSSVIEGFVLALAAALLARRRRKRS